jgi:hypothetical protein
MTRHGESILLLLLGVTPGVVVAVGAFVVVPQFQEVFTNFGAELPFVTSLLLATFRWWGIFPVVALALWLSWPNPANRGAAAVVFGATSAAVLFLFGWYACYAPIFQLADVVR